MKVNFRYVQGYSAVFGAEFTGWTAGAVAFRNYVRCQPSSGKHAFPMRHCTQEELTGKSDDCSKPPVPLLTGALGSGLGALPWNELIELLTLPVGVGVWLSVNPSFSSFDPRPLAPCSDACDPATEPFCSAFVAAAAFSWFFLLLKRNAIVGRRSASSGGRLSSSY